LLKMNLPTFSGYGNKFSATEFEMGGAAAQP
jgi:hypothetical protein